MTHKDCAICHFSLQFLTFPGTKFIEEREGEEERDEETEEREKKRTTDGDFFNCASSRTVW